jgi:hypothetical protein
LKKRIVVVDTERRQDSTDPVGKADTLGDQLGSLADASPRILVCFVRDRYHGADAGLAAKPRQQGTQEQLGIDAIGLGAAHAPIIGHARRLDNINLDAFCDQPSRQPEPRPSSFIDRDNPIDRMAGGSGASPVAVNGGLKSKFSRLLWSASPWSAAAQGFGRPEPSSCY